MLDLRKALAEQDTDTLELYLGPDWMTKIHNEIWDKARSFFCNNEDDTD